MTEIDVPDWVVEAALLAGFLFVCLREGREFSEDEFRNGRDSMDAENRQAAAEMMKAALTAALGAWVVPESVQFQDPDGKQWWSFNGQESCRYAESLLWPKRTLYTLRQEKPE